MAFSVVIPVAPGDDTWRSLLADLTFLSDRDEVLVSSPHDLRSSLQESISKCEWPFALRWIRSPIGRAKQLNNGAKQAKNEVLWFLHGDSKVSGSAYRKLEESLACRPDDLHFFNLRFQRDGPPFMKFNEAGAWFRSHFLRLPFGDQGFCLRREVFLKLGQFPEEAPYGEDHLLIWRAHRNRVSLRCVGESLLTSARRYQTCGWRKTTSRHLFLTISQALPEFCGWLKARASL